MKKSILLKDDSSKQKNFECCRKMGHFYTNKIFLKNHKFRSIFSIFGCFSIFEHISKVVVNSWNFIPRFLLLILTCIRSLKSIGRSGIKLWADQVNWNTLYYKFDKNECPKQYQATTSIITTTANITASSPTNNPTSDFIIAIKIILATCFVALFLSFYRKYAWILRRNYTNFENEYVEMDL